MPAETLLVPPAHPLHKAPVLFDDTYLYSGGPSVSKGDKGIEHDFRPAERQIIKDIPQKINKVIDTAKQAANYTLKKAKEQIPIIGLRYGDAPKGQHDVQSYYDKLAEGAAEFFLGLKVPDQKHQTQVQQHTKRFNEIQNKLYNTDAFKSMPKQYQDTVRGEVYDSMVKPFYKKHGLWAPTKDDYISSHYGQPGQNVIAPSFGAQVHKFGREIGTGALEMLKPIGANIDPSYKSLLHMQENYLGTHVEDGTLKNLIYDSGREMIGKLPLWALAEGAAAEALEVAPTITGLGWLDTLKVGSKPAQLLHHSIQQALVGYTTELSQTGSQSSSLKRALSFAVWPWALEGGKQIVKPSVKLLAKLLGAAGAKVTQQIVDEGVKVAENQASHTEIQIPHTEVKAPYAEGQTNDVIMLHHLQELAKQPDIKLSQFLNATTAHLLNTMARETGQKGVTNYNLLSPELKQAVLEKLGVDLQTASQQVIAHSPVAAVQQVANNLVEQYKDNPVLAANAAELAKLTGRPVETSVSRQVVQNAQGNIVHTVESQLEHVHAATQNFTRMPGATHNDLPNFTVGAARAGSPEFTEGLVKLFNTIFDPAKGYRPVEDTRNKLLLLLGSAEAKGSEGKQLHDVLMHYLHADESFMYKDPKTGVTRRANDTMIKRVATDVQNKYLAILTQVGDAGQKQRPLFASTFRRTADVPIDSKGFYTYTDQWSKQLANELMHWQNLQQQGKWAEADKFLKARGIIEKANMPGGVSGGSGTTKFIAKDGESLNIELKQDTNIHKDILEDIPNAQKHFKVEINSEQFGTVADASFYLSSDNKLHPYYIRVKEDWQRLGIGTAIYNKIEEETGLKVELDKEQTDAGRKFRKKRKDVEDTSGVSGGSIADGFITKNGWVSSNGEFTPMIGSHASTAIREKIVNTKDGMRAQSEAMAKGFVRVVVNKQGAIIIEGAQTRDALNAVEHTLMRIPHNKPVTIELWKDISRQRTTDNDNGHIYKVFEYPGEAYEFIRHLN